MKTRRSSYPLVLTAMGGLGDCIYARPFIRAWCAAKSSPVWISSPWPQLYRDMENARFMAPWGMGLRTQQKNMRSLPPGTWDAHPPARAERKRFTYRLLAPGASIVREIEEWIGLPGEFVFDLPDFGPSPVGGAVAVIRPVTVRREWANTARSPDPAYVARAAEMLRAAGYTTVLVADIDERHEPAAGDLPDCDHAFIRGELAVDQLLALVQHASVVVGGIGWIVPASIATGTPAVFIGGGQGGANGPAVVTDPRMDTSRVRFVLPDDYCVCKSMYHDCPKHISDFDARFAAALAEVAC